MTLQNWRKNTSTEEEALAFYRRVREEIRAYVENLPQWLESD